MTSLREQNEDLRRTLLAWLEHADELLDQRNVAQALVRRCRVIVEAAADEEALSWRGHDATGLLLELDALPWIDEAAQAPSAQQKARGTPRAAEQDEEEARDENRAAGDQPPRGS